MTRTLSHLTLSLLLCALSLLLAVGNTLLGQRVNYLDYLTFFNVMAVSMLALSVAALATGALGTWKARGRSPALWLANAIALLLLGAFLFDR